jgi:glyoxylase-like metal-dependent hydrolase (beta-lactamase superfamily II)
MSNFASPPAELGVYLRLIIVHLNQFSPVETEVHPATFFGNIPNWRQSLKPLFESHYKQLVPGHGPAVEDEQTGREYFKRMYDYLEDFHGHLLEIKSGRRTANEVTDYMLNRRRHSSLF